VASICIADLLLSPVGYIAAVASVSQSYAFLFVLPLLGILALSAEDRRMRIRQSRELWSAYRGSAMLLDRVVAADDRLTGEHGRGVVDLAMRVGDELDIDPQERVELEFAALLHDVGKLAIDNEIINKRGPLTPEEFTAIKRHTIEGHRMLEQIGGLLGRVGVIVRSCHERWDGAGYPDGLAGEAIPLTARIVFCCDAFHAMTTDRSYRAARPPEQALAEVHANAGTQFDPMVADALTRALGLPDTGRVERDGAEHRARRTLALDVEGPPIASNEGLLGLNPDGTVHSMNSAAVRLLGWSAEDAVGHPLHELVLHSYPNGTPYPREASPIEATLRTGEERAAQVEVLWRKDGAALPVRYSMRPADEGRAGAVLEFKPLVARTPAEEALRLGEELYRSLARNLENAAVVLFDHDLRVLVVEGEPLARPGLRDDAITRRRLQDVLPATAWELLERPARAALRGERAEFEFASDDERRFYRVTVGPMRDDRGAVQGGLAVAEDITRTRNRTEQLDRLAHHDVLTGLTNRAAFFDLADRALRRAGRTQRVSALLFIDLDGFKAVNDTRGHETGDQVLRTVAARLERTVRDVDTVARIGGDEFAVLLDGVHDEAEAAIAAQRILKAVAAPLDIDGNQPPPVTASVGIALQAGVHQTSAELLGAADEAMYRAKGLGGDRVQFFHASRSGDLQLPVDDADALARAVERGELCVHYQPEVDVETGDVVAVEALVRWRHPERGLLPPAAFLGAAERDGVIDAIDDWVMRTACAQGTAWASEGLPPFRIAVNVSDDHARQYGFEESVRRRLRDAGLPPDRLELEVSERLLADPDRRGEEAMRSLRADGARISIDHFGTEEAPPDRLETFPADAVKIDRRFVRSLPEDAETALSLIGVAHERGCEVVAGGVETAEQLAALRSGGCDVAVGHLISHPVPADQLTTWLHSRSGDGRNRAG
jgi:diguanylate cyclase (GGDEF)-like protein/PAS domain S-box-containing protein